MTPDEALKLCRFAKALSPAQAVDEYQPEAWALVLRRWRLVDAMRALEELGAEQEWIHVSHIVARVRRIRRDRVEDFGPLPQPPRSLDPDDTRAHQAWLAETTRLIADETYDAEPVTALPAHDVTSLGSARSADESLADPIAKVRAAHATALRELQATRKPAPAPLLTPSDHSREPEPDRTVNGKSVAGVHGCDGCCNPGDQDEREDATA